MKRIVPATLLFLFIIGISICSMYYTKNVCNETAEKIEKCYTEFSSGNLESASRTAEELKEEWHRKHKRLSAFVYHHLLDDVTVYIEQIPLYSKLNYEEKFYTACQNADTVLEQIVHESKFKISCFY